MTLGSTPTPAQILAELSQSFPYTFPDARMRWLADLGASASIVFPTSFANKQSVKTADSLADAGGSSPHTFSGLNFGLAFSDRVLIACTCLRGNGSGALDISAVTIGGVSAVGDNHGNLIGGGSGPAIGAGLYAAAVPSGTSGDVVVTWSGQNANASGIILLSVAKISTTAYNATNVVYTDGGGTVANDTLNIPANGVLVLAVAHTNTNDTTLGGVTERSALNVGSGRLEVGFDNRMSLESNRAVSGSWSGSAARALIGMSYTQI